MCCAARTTQHVATSKLFTNLLEYIFIQFISFDVSKHELCVQGKYEYV